MYIKIKGMRIHLFENKSQFTFVHAFYKGIFAGRISRLRVFLLKDSQLLQHVT